ncbi:MAG: RpoL/Rpb11 RNA polymerase subunit family protein [Candidatus Micrarchaeaceae archaeon]
MAIKIIKDEGKEIWLEFESGDTTVPDLIAASLIDRSNIEFAGVRKDHPEVGKPVLVVKAKRNAKDELQKALSELGDSFKDLESQLSKSK